MSAKKNIFIYNADEVNADTIKDYIKEKREVIAEQERTKELESLYPNGLYKELPFIFDREAQELTDLYKKESYRKERIETINHFTDEVINKDMFYFSKLTEYRNKNIITKDDLNYCI